MKTKDEIMAEARSNIAKFHAGNLELEVEDEPRQVNLPPLAVEDRSVRWRNFHAEREADRRRARAELRRKEGKMANAPTPAPAGPMTKDEMFEALGEALGIAREQIRRELRAELAGEISELKGQVTAILALLGGTKAADIIALPRKRPSDAA
jgi:hypothetical protein